MYAVNAYPRIFYCVHALKALHKWHAHIFRPI